MIVKEVKYNLRTDMWGYIEHEHDGTGFVKLIGGKEFDSEEEAKYYQQQCEQKLTPKKLIRSGITEMIKPDEWERITDPKTLDELYALKVKEELNEIINSHCDDINEFADLITVIKTWANIHGFSNIDLLTTEKDKRDAKGEYSNIVLTNLNPENPSNKIYFEQ